MRSLNFAVFLVLFLNLPFSVYAASYPDVSETHRYYEEIERLTALKIISGNPDGFYYPENKLNRAEILKMIYLAAGKVPPAAKVACFIDVKPEDWFAPYVCHAAKSGYVKGYADNLFKPGNNVTRAEAIKMVLEVLDFPLATGAADLFKKYTDVFPDDWYVYYFATAFELGMIDSESENRIMPSENINRGEAAFIIYRALGLSEDEETGKETEENQDSGNADPGIEKTMPVTYVNVAETVEITKEDFKIESDGQFIKRQPDVYTFKFNRSTTVKILAELKQAGTMTCRLYRVGELGFSDQYNLGLQQENDCRILTTVTAGSYTLQLQGSVSDGKYILIAENAVSDGNDGFSQAKNIRRGSTLSGVLEETDLEDWYTFKVTSAPLNMTVQTEGTDVGCLVYAMNDVDMFGFSGPVCNRSYEFPPGTYYISVRKTANLDKTNNYRVQLK